jgi:phosphoribosylformimino-5-aminoimidazole carboxamide ribotide isomerase
MIIYPAVDLRGGRCVRLQRGDLAAESVFAADPVDAARRWVAEGAEWLHVVNLDGALGRSGAENLYALERILAAVQIPVQFGGGLRAIEDVERLLNLGVARVILGTVAVRQPQVVQEATARYGAERISVGIDVRDGCVVIQGWVETSSLEAVALAQRMASLGVRRIIYTDVGRDGMLSGVNVEATTRLARLSGLRVIASGGVASLEDVRLLRVSESEGIEGVIIGMALYRGAIRLDEALQIAGGAPTNPGG